MSYTKKQTLQIHYNTIRVCAELLTPFTSTEKQLNLLSGLLNDIIACEAILTGKE